MPIDYKKYPKNWKEVSRNIRERDGWKCAWCGLANGVIGYRHHGGFVELADCKANMGMEVDAAVDDGHRVIQIVLTVAHLDHEPMNCDPSNLVALCQKCHLNYDQDHHRRNASATRRAKRVRDQPELF
jgi:5-methylcytosine-specific restriction endonuclease McrA